MYARLCRAIFRTAPVLSRVAGAEIAVEAASPIGGVLLRHPSPSWQAKGTSPIIGAVLPMISLIDQGAVACPLFHTSCSDHCVYAVQRDGEIAAIGLWYISSIPLNLSYLCNRLEVLVHPDVPDRDTLVYALAARVQMDAATTRTPVLTALVEPQDEAALVRAGFQAIGRQYGKFTWAREGERTYTASALSIVEWYGEIHHLNT